MADLAGAPTLARVLNRSRQITLVDEIALATTTNPEDNILEDWASSQALPVFRGSEKNVVERLLLANKLFDGTHIARITADCPLIDPFVCDEVIAATLEEDADFGSNHSPPTYPDGLDFSIMKVDKLSELFVGGLSNYDLEHVTTPFEKESSPFRKVNVLSGVNLSSHRWTLDNHQDLVFLRSVFEQILSRNSTSDHDSVLKILEQKPEILQLQSKMSRNYAHVDDTTGTP